MNINSKMLLYILSTSVVILICSIGYITLKSNNLALERTQEIALKNSREYANEIKSHLLSDFNTTKTLAEIGKAYLSLPWDEWNKVFLQQQFNIINSNPYYLGVATSWELNHIDPNWDKPYGRYLNGWVRDKNGKVNQIETKLNTEGDDLLSLYYIMKSTGKSMIVDPELYSPTGKVEDQYLNSNLSVPIKLGNTHIGLACIDVDLNRFQDIIVNIKPFKGSYAFLLSNNSSFVAHPKHELMGKLFSNKYRDVDMEFNITEKIKKGENFSFTTENEQGEKIHYVFSSIKIDGIDTPWSLAISVPNKVITEKARNILYNAIGVCFIGLLLLTIIIALIAKNITHPIKHVTSTLKSLALGKIDKSLISKVNSKDEVGEMIDALNTSINGLNQKSEFAKQIGTGEISCNLDLLSKDDKLGKSLLEMQDCLKQAKEKEEERKSEDKKQSWINNGLTMFSDILRKNNHNIQLLTRDIIKNLVSYLDSNQGGLFLIDKNNEEETILKLSAAFAYDRDKFIEKTVELGEGLVGSCAIEKETIYITEIPQNYITISSGLGDANPNSLLLVPMITDNQLQGVIEIASFKEFKPHQIHFTELVARNIASILKSTQINIETSLLLEQSQQQSEEMAAQEEEMRQNMEELQATQEEATRKENILRGTIDAVDSFLLKADLNLDFTIQNTNHQLRHKLNYNQKEITGLNTKNILSDKSSDKFEEIYNSVLNGKSFQENITLNAKTGKKLNMITSFTPVFIDERIEKILFLAVDINDFKQK